jgi:AAA domain
MNTPSLGLGSWLEQSGLLPGSHETLSNSSEASGTPNQHDTEVAVEFLDDLDSNGRHDLTAMNPDKRTLDNATFVFPEDRDNGKAASWIEERQGRLNLYLSVNRACDSASPNTRLNYNERKEIGWIRAIVSDIDVPKKKGGDSSGEHFHALRARLLTEVVPKIAADSDCPPSSIVDSGGGVQLWWMLDDPIPATPENVDMVEGIARTINDQIREEFPEFQVDTVADPARLMRLPGTINTLDQRKRDQGRSPTPATVLEDHSLGLKYSIEQLKAEFPPTKGPQYSSSESEIPKIDMAVVRAANSYDELPAELREKFENAREHDPALRDVWDGIPFIGQKDATRSGFVFALAVRLKRADGFTATEFGQLLWVWEHGYADEPDKIGRRLIGRAWNHAGGSADGYDPVGDERKAQSAQHSSGDVLARKPLKLAPFKPVAPSEIPPRKWLIYGLLCCRNISLLAGPPGVSKTTLLLMVALALATGREDILGMPVIKRSRVSFWNQEDPIDELQRRVAAICKAFGIKDQELLDESGKPMLWLNSGVDDPFFLATAGERQQVKRGASVDDMIAEIKANCIEALILDPMVEFHETEESNNGQMRRVMGFAREIVNTTGCAGYIGTHTRKPDKASSKGFAGDMDAIRGASSQVGAARIAHTLLLASADDAKKWSMEGSHYEYVRLDMAKNNLGRRWSEPRWFRFGEERIGEDPVGVLKPAPLGPIEDNRADILAEAMHKTGLTEARATEVVAGLPQEHRKLFGKKAHWAREVKGAFFGPLEHETKWGALSWSSSGGKTSPLMLHLKTSPTVH